MTICCLTDTYTLLCLQRRDSLMLTYGAASAAVKHMLKTLGNKQLRIDYRECEIMSHYNCFLSLKLSFSFFGLSNTSYLNHTSVGYFGSG